MKQRDDRNHATRRRQESLRAVRDRMIAYGHHEQAIKILKEFEDESKEIDSQMLARKSKALDGHIKILGMVVPKPVELSQDQDNPLFSMTSDDRYTEYTRLVQAIRRGSGTDNPAASNGKATH